MKMKYMAIHKNIYLSAAFLLSIATTSCNEFLDITPDGQEKQETIMQTPEGIESALYGVYSQMRTTSLYGSNLSFKVLDIMAQHFTVYGGNNDHLEALANYDYTYSGVQDDFENIWTAMYNNISNVNAVIGCDLLSSDNLSYPYNIYKGEALGLRAFMHFDLMRIFTEQYTLNPSAQGIPYATTFSLDTPDFSTAAECYDYILSDLLEAERLLADEEKYGDKGKYDDEGKSGNEGKYSDEDGFMKDRQIHFNLHAVRATLARVYLTMGRKGEALAYAKKVIEESGRKLTGTISLYGDVAGILSNNETIFGIYYNEFYSIVSPNLQQHVSWSSLEPRRDCKDLFSRDGEDLRLSAYFQDDLAYSVPTFIKLTDVYELNGMSRPADIIPGINLIRLPEMYYIVAECLMDDDPMLATEYFDTVIEHRGLTKLGDRPTPVTLSLDVIDAERYKEFWGEGQSFFNLKRRDAEITLPDETKVKPVYVVPVPDVEFDYRR